MEIIQFLFSGFWIWLGGLFYLTLIVWAISEFRIVEMRSGMHNAEIQIKGKDRTDAEAAKESD